MMIIIATIHTGVHRNGSLKLESLLLIEMDGPLIIRSHPQINLLNNATQVTPLHQLIQQG